MITIVKKLKNKINAYFEMVLLLNDRSNKILEKLVALEKCIDEIKRSETKNSAIIIGGLENLEKIALDTRYYTTDTVGLVKKISEFSQKSWIYQCIKLSSLTGSKLYEIKQKTDLPAFNPSLIIYKDKLVTVERVSNFLCVADKKYYYQCKPHETKNLMQIMNVLYEVESAGFVDDIQIRMEAERIYRDSSYCGIEDIRLFVVNDEIHGIGAAVLSRNDELTTVQILFQLNPESREIKTPIIVGSPTASNFEKNWIPFFYNGYLHIIYSVSPYVIYRLEGKNLILCDVSDAVNIDHLSIEIQGGSNLIQLGKYLVGIAHDKKIVADKIYYTHRFYRLDKNLRLVDISDSFVFESRGIEFAVGMVLVDEKILISYGLSDRKSKILSLPVTALDGMFNE